MDSFPETYNDPHRDFRFDIYIGSLLSKIYFTAIVYYIYTFCTYMFFRLLAYMCKFDNKRNVAFQELVEDNFSFFFFFLI